MFVRDLDLAEFKRFDARRLEVVADGLHQFGGAQLAIDTTMVSLSTGMGRRAEAQPGLSLGRSMQEERTHLP